MCFTDFVPDADMRSTLGIYYLSLSLGNIFVHLVMMFGSSLVSIKNHIRRKGCLCCKKTMNVKKSSETTKSKHTQIGPDVDNSEALGEAV